MKQVVFKTDGPFDAVVTNIRVGFRGNVSGKGYDHYIDFPGWGPDRDDGRAHKAENLNEVAIPELKQELRKNDITVRL